MRKAILAAVVLMLTGAAKPLVAVDAAVRAGMRETGAKGLAVAVVENGHVVFQRGYGLRNA